MRRVLSLALLVFKLIIFALGLLKIYISMNPAYNYITLGQEYSARCLDGTKPGFAYFKGPEESRKFMIYFQGGGWCGTPITKDEVDAESVEDTIRSCLWRSRKAFVGGSNVWTHLYRFFTFDLQLTEYLNFGILRRDPKVNPLLSDYHTLFVSYCDGMMHQGYKTDPIEVEGQKIWIQGDQIVRDILAYSFQHLNLGKAEKLIVSGFSAGGIAASIWVDEISEIVNQKTGNHTEVVALVDSPLFFDLPNLITQKNSYTQNLKNIVQIANQERLPPQRSCVEKNRNSPWKCFQGDEILRHVKSRVLLVQGFYDTYNLRYVMGLKCFNIWLLDFFGSPADCSSLEFSRAQDLGHATNSSVQRLLRENENISFWVPSCFNHCFTVQNKYYNSPNFSIQKGPDSYTLAQVLEAFLTTNKRQVFIDSLPYPHNRGCLKSSSEYELFVSGA